MSQKTYKYTSAKGKEVLWCQGEEWCKSTDSELSHAKPTDKYIRFDISDKMLKKKCKGCGHSIRSHYCEITIGSSDLRGRDKTYTKRQHCMTCGMSNECYSVVSNLDREKPILNFHAWEKKK